MILIRVIVCMVLFCLPFLLLVAASGKPEAMLWLIFPFFGAIPAVLGALLVFWPLEAWLDRHGKSHLKNRAIPIAGALLVFVFALVMWTLSGNVLQNLGRLFSGEGEGIWPFAVWSVLGAFWGGLWRFTAWVGTRLVRRFGRRPASA